MEKKSNSTNFKGATNGYPKYKAYSLHNFTAIPQIQNLPEEIRFAIQVVGHVLPFKVNRYVVDELINWQDVPNDPIFKLTFPQQGMLLPDHFQEMTRALKNGIEKSKRKAIANRIRTQLNPHPAGQLESNVPLLDGEKLSGIQHKYRETILFFPSQGQTCHAYCTFCFRWPQFVGIREWKFAMKEAQNLTAYLSENPQVTDIIFTGGDPMIMQAGRLAHYIEAILDANLPNLQNIRIGSKALSYWPYRFLTDKDADQVLGLFEKIVKAGKHLAFMAHFTHPRELSTPAVIEAINRIRQTGAEIRTQSPLLRHINDDPKIWAEMWKTEVKHGCIPYYMFVVRDTGAQHYFGIPLVKSWKIFKNAYQRVSGIGRTVRGPSMSCLPGKVQVLGVSDIRGEKVIVLRMLQGRNSEWVNRPFYAEYDERAIWFDELKPAFGKERFFFEENPDSFNRHRAMIKPAKLIN